MKDEIHASDLKGLQVYFEANYLRVQSMFFENLVRRISQLD